MSRKGRRREVKINKRILIMIILAILMFPQTVQAKTTKILLVGDSKTSREDIPGKFRALCKKGKKKVEVTFVKNTGLIGIANNRSTRLRVTGKKFDYVILQQETRFHQPSMYERYLNDTKKAVAVIRQKSPDAAIILRQTWMLTGHSSAYKKRAKEIVEKIVKKLKIDICYDGQAFYYSRKHYPEIRIYSDNRHQNKAGAYLCACSLYYTVFGESPVGLTYYGGLPKGTAKKLQKAAYQSILNAETKNRTMGK